jgi:hypothetical protein
VLRAISSDLRIPALSCERIATLKCKKIVLALQLLASFLGLLRRAFFVLESQTGDFIWASK